jgi:hypothetical protein
LKGLLEKIDEILVRQILAEARINEVAQRGVAVHVYSKYW